LHWIDVLLGFSTPIVSCGILFLSAFSRSANVVTPKILSEIFRETRLLVTIEVTAYFLSIPTPAAMGVHMRYRPRFEYVYRRLNASSGIIRIFDGFRQVIASKQLT